MPCANSWTPPLICVLLQPSWYGCMCVWLCEWVCVCVSAWTTTSTTANLHNVFMYSLICDIDFIMVIPDHYLDTWVCLYSVDCCLCYRKLRIKTQWWVSTWQNHKLSEIKFVLINQKIKMRFPQTCRMQTSTFFTFPYLTKISTGKLFDHHELDTGESKTVIKNIYFRHSLKDSQA